MGFSNIEYTSNKENYQSKKADFVRKIKISSDQSKIWTANKLQANESFNQKKYQNVNKHSLIHKLFTYTRSFMKFTLQ